jgi:hypothetical protein
MAGKFNGRGFQYYASQAVNIEKQYQTAVASTARLAPSDRAGVAAASAKVAECIQQLDLLRTQVEGEKNAFLLWGENQTKHGMGLLFRGSAQQYMQQVRQTATGYDEIVRAINVTQTEWRAWLSRSGVSLVQSDGSRRCAAGHDNHPVRTVCAVCGRSL